MNHEDAVTNKSTQFTDIYYLFLLLFIVALKGLWVLGAIAYSEIGLSPDEAQYWTWSQALDWGYYSKPPGIAWQIHLSTLLFGQTELGVRFSALVIGSLIPFATYTLARTCKLQSSTCFIASAIIALSPLGFAASFFATTDGGLVLFWIFACAVVASGLSQRSINYPLLGLVILCGALFKWTIFLFWLFLIPFITFYFRSSPLSWKLLIGILISLLGLIPSILWNRTHEWATFRHVLTQTLGNSELKQNPPFFHGNFFDFLGAQAALVSPLLFLLLILSLIYLCRNCANRSIPAPLIFCGFLCLTTVGVYSILAIKQKMQGNWAVFAYPSGIVLMSWYMCEKITSGKRWLWIGTAISILLSILIFSIPYLQAHKNPIPTISCRYNPFKHCVGWNKLSPALLHAGYDPNKHFLFSDKYQNSSILSFYAPDQKRAYFFNLYQNRHNQFSYWPGIREKQKEESGFFIVIDSYPNLDNRIKEHQSEYETRLKPYFDQIDLQGIYPLFFCNEEPYKVAIIFKCSRYNGLEPLETTSF